MSTKNIFIVIIFLFVFVFLSIDLYAAPFLVSDPQADADGFKISWDIGGVWQECGKEKTSATEIRIKQDLAGISAGKHDVLLKAYNSWGESSAVPFAFIKQSPRSPTNIGLEQYSPPPPPPPPLPVT